MKCPIFYKCVVMFRLPTWQSRGCIRANYTKYIFGFLANARQPLDAINKRDYNYSRKFQH